MSEFLGKAAPHFHLTVKCTDTKKKYAEVSGKSEDQVDQEECDPCKSKGKYINNGNFYKCGCVKRMDDIEHTKKDAHEIDVGVGAFG